MGKTISLFLCSLCLCVAANAADLQLQENAPGRYIVVQGDTLWGISARYLKDPWRWAELWKMNRDQLKNPHLIYPGNILILDKNTASLRLAGRQTIKLSPKTRAESLQAAAIPSIPTSVIEPFLSQPLIVEQSTLDQAARIAALQESHVAVGSGDVVYVQGISEDQGKSWQKISDLKDGRFGPIFGKNADHLFVLAQAGIVESTDGGKSWAKAIPAPKDMKGVSTLSWLEYDPVNDTLYVMKMGSELFRWQRK